MLYSIKTHCADLVHSRAAKGVLRRKFAFRRYIRFFLLCTVLSPFNPAYADLRSWSGSLEVSSVGSAEDKVLWNLRPAVNLRGEQPLWNLSAWSLGLETRLRADTQSNFVRSRKRYDFRVDKAALQWIGDSASANFGWQKFTWGDTGFLDGVDVLNARDLSEPLYTDDELQKLAVPSASLQYLASSTVFQLVVIPQPERTPLEENFGGIPLTKPNPLSFGKQFEFGLKAGGLLSSGWDINGYLASHLERVPQIVQRASPQGVQLLLYEPRVFTLGLTATQSVGDFVFRGESAVHVNRALPEPGLVNQISSSQLVLNLTGDLTLFQDLLVSGQVWTERWTAPSSVEFKRSNFLLGARAQKPFFSGRLEASLGALGSFASRENLMTSGLNFRAFEAWQFTLDVYFAKTSKEHALARRQFKDLIRSSLKYQF